MVQGATGDPPWYDLPIYNGSRRAYIRPVARIDMPYIRLTNEDTLFTIRDVDERPRLMNAHMTDVDILLSEFTEGVRSAISRPLVAATYRGESLNPHFSSAYDFYTIQKSYFSKKDLDRLFSDSNKLDPSNIREGNVYKMIGPYDLDDTTILICNLEMRCETADLDRNTFVFLIHTHPDTRVVLKGLNSYPIMCTLSCGYAEDIEATGVTEAVGPQGPIRVTRQQPTAEIDHGRQLRLIEQEMDRLRFEGTVDALREPPFNGRV